MGRIGTESAHHHQQGGLEFEEIHQTPGEPPAAPAKATPQVHSFPPAQEETPQVFPPNQQPQIFINCNVPLPQKVIPMGVAPPPLIAQQNQPWKTHLFDCMKDPQNAIVTLCFPCVTFGQIAEVLDNGSTSCATSAILYSCIALCIGMPCLMSCGYRSKLRAKFGLVESPAPDWLIHCFCDYCALCQEYRELQERGLDPSIGHAGNVAKQQRQFGMTSPMQQNMMM